MILHRYHVRFRWISHISSKTTFLAIPLNSSSQTPAARNHVLSLMAKEEKIVKEPIKVLRIDTKSVREVSYSFELD